MIRKANETQAHKPPSLTTRRIRVEPQQVKAVVAGNSYAFAISQATAAAANYVTAIPGAILESAVAGIRSVAGYFFAAKKQDTSFQETARFVQTMQVPAPLDPRDMLAKAAERKTREALNKLYEIPRK